MLTKFMCTSTSKFKSQLALGLSLTLWTLCASKSALAALAPYYDSLEKMNAVVNALKGKVFENQVTATLTNITWVKGLTYQVKAGECQVQVSIKAVVDAAGLPGKTTYEVETIGQPHCN